MNVIPFVHEGLGNSSYLVDAGNGSAVLVDPDRNVQRYVAAAGQAGLRIAHVLETHLHADFVSGAHELLAGAGARLLLPRDARSRLSHQPLAAGERIHANGVEIDVVGSPGHTPEHLSYVLRTAAGPARLFSGGSLIIGGAARTDLIAPEQTEALTRAQYRTITRAFASLRDDTLLYPTHGGGSFCSTGAGAERTSTLGDERARNPLLAIEDEDDFVRYFPTTFPGTPEYYFRMREINRRGPRLKSTIARPRPLAPTAFQAASNGTLIIDTRDVRSYARAHVAGSLHIPFRDSFAVWAGWLAPPDVPLLFVADEGVLDRVLDECLLVGLEHFAGWLEGGMEAWSRAGLPVRTAEIIDGRAAAALRADGAAVIDVREPSEFAAAHVEGATSIPLGTIAARAIGDMRGRPVVVHCGHAERASSAVSILERKGIDDARIVEGGADAIISALAA